MFAYLRIFSIVSLFCVIVIAVAGGMLFRGMAEDDLIGLIQKNNTILTQGYIDNIWSRYRSVILPLADDPAKAKPGDPQVTEFARETMAYFKQMPLMTVNLYSPNGRLLFSVSPSAAGKLAGNAISPDNAFLLSQMKRAGSNSNLLPDVALADYAHASVVQAVTPMRLESNGKTPPDGALEVLYNITDVRREMQSFQILGTGGIIFLFIIFLGMLQFISRRAEGIITKQHEANRELAEAAEAAKAENQQKSQFLANISHELRTPLNAIIGFSDILKNELIPALPDPKYANFINDINTSGVHLLSLINDILDFSKAEAGKLELEVAEINVNKTIQNCLRLVSPRAEAAQVHLVENLPKDALIMLTDAKKFKQVLLNLLSNAVKFTPPEGKVSVTAWSNVKDDTLTFEVTDTGIGIAPKDISRAMSPFGQVDNSLKRKYDGTGLGLPLTKKFVELLGGKFMIDSELNVGTRITFILPREIKPQEGLVIKPAE